MKKTTYAIRPVWVVFLALVSMIVGFSASRFVSPVAFVTCIILGLVIGLSALLAALMRIEVVEVRKEK